MYRLCVCGEEKWLCRERERWVWVLTERCSNSILCSLVSGWEDKQTPHTKYSRMEYSNSSLQRTLILAIFSVVVCSEIIKCLTDLLCLSCKIIVIEEKIANVWFSSSSSSKAYYCERAFCYNPIMCTINRTLCFVVEFIQIMNINCFVSQKRRLMIEPNDWHSNVISNVLVFIFFDSRQQSYPLLYLLQMTLTICFFVKFFFFLFFAFFGRFLCTNIHGILPSSSSRHAGWMVEVVVV